MSGVTPIRVCVAGVTGWAGGPIAEAVRRAPDLELVAGVSRSDPASYSSVAEALDAVPADVLVDYTHATVVKENVAAAIERGANAVVGSSGLQAGDYDELDAAARERGVGVIAAGNFSLTAALLLRAAVEAARHLDAWEVIDYASAAKADAPSGTARELAERLGEVRPPSVGVPVEEIVGPREARGTSVGGSQVHSVRCRALSSRPRSSSPRQANASRSDTTRGRRPTRTSQERCWPSARSRDASASPAGSTGCSASRSQVGHS
jgi:4-hydroxy-tetrahydrodipicolinate reductase